MVALHSLTIIPTSLNSWPHVTATLS